MPGGRPLITTKDFGDDWQERLYDLAKEGASIVELAVELDIDRGTLYNLSKRDQEFFNTIKRCKVLAEKWWEEQGRTNLQNKDFNYTGWYMNMKNRYKWKDRHDHTSNDKQLPTPIISLNTTDDIKDKD